mmetsp:Transcript_25631/g.71674  ORF Transcript_25631/g.71674 Transcript_25631/m.71674 type:complete len:151 (-) Transcript_25631:50-502(-)
MSSPEPAPAQCPSEISRSLPKSEAGLSPTHLLNERGPDSPFAEGADIASHETVWHLLEELEALQHQLLEQVAKDKTNSVLVSQLQSALNQQNDKLKLVEQALHSAEGSLARERQARMKAEKKLAEERAQRKSLVSQVVIACTDVQTHSTL